MRTLTLWLVSLLVSSSAWAGGLMIGVDAGLANVKNHLDATIYEGGVSRELNESFSSRSYSLGVRLGYLFAEEHRLYLGYAYAPRGEVDANRAKSQKSYIAYDFTPMLHENTRAILGVLVGQNRITTSGIRGGTSPSFYGAKVGLLREVDEHTEMELSLKVDHTKFNLNYQDGTKRVKSDLKQTNLAICVGYTYKF